MAKTIPRANPLLLGAAAADFLLALLHVAVVILGPMGYSYFGTAALARLATRGSTVPAVLTLLIALLFAAFGVYALSGAGWMRSLPLLTAVLVVISALYILRGLVLVPDLIGLATGAGYPLRQTLFSAGSLVIGIVHAVGVVARKRPGPIVE